ncbi:hypothetical protein CBL_00870 [Carabus blaptoides fortunei]
MHASTEEPSGKACYQFNIVCCSSCVRGRHKYRTTLSFQLRHETSQDRNIAKQVAETQIFPIAATDKQTTYRLEYTSSNANSDDTVVFVQLRLNKFSQHCGSEHPENLFANYRILRRGLTENKITTYVTEDEKQCL